LGEGVGDIAKGGSLGHKKKGPVLKCSLPWDFRRPGEILRTRKKRKSTTGSKRKKKAVATGEGE